MSASGPKYPPPAPPPPRRGGSSPQQGAPAQPGPPVPEQPIEEPSGARQIRPPDGPAQHDVKTPSRSRGPFLAVAAVVAVLGLAVFVGVRSISNDPATPSNDPLPTGSTDPTSEPTEDFSGFDTAQDEDLWLSVPPTDCVSDGYEQFTPTFEDEVSAAIICRPNHEGVITVEYWAFFDNDGMDAEYNDGRVNFNLPIAQGNCATDSVAEHAWANGRVACWVGQNGVAYIMWTHEGRSILSTAWSDTGDEGSLYQFWGSAESGP